MEELSKWGMAAVVEEGAVPPTKRGDELSSSAPVGVGLEARSTSRVRATPSKVTSLLVELIPA